MFDVVGGGEKSPSSFSTAEVSSSWCIARFVVVSGAAVIGFRPLFVGVTESLVSSVSDRSMIDDESSARRSFFVMVLPALLSSLTGGVCSLVMFGGRTGRVAVTLGLLLVGLLVLDRSFIFPKVEEVGLMAVLDVDLSLRYGIKPRT